MKLKPHVFVLFSLGYHKIVTGGRTFASGGSTHVVDVAITMPLRAYVCTHVHVTSEWKYIYVHVHCQMMILLLIE